MRQNFSELFKEAAKIEFILKFKIAGNFLDAFSDQM